MSDLENTLEKWHENKQKALYHQKKADKYRSQIETEMKKRNLDRLSTDKFVVDRKTINKTYMAKSNIPSNVWNEYATKCSYYAYYLKRR